MDWDDDTTEGLGHFRALQASEQLARLLQEEEEQRRAQIANDLRIAHAFAEHDQAFGNPWGRLEAPRQPTIPRQPVTPRQPVNPRASTAATRQGVPATSAVAGSGEWSIYGYITSAFTWLLGDPTNSQDLVKKPHPYLASQPCIVCFERVGGLFYVKAPCGHIYDVGCMTSLARSATSDESLFPPRCCSRPIGYDLFNALIPLDVWKAFERASQEFSVVAKDRIYCPRPTCSKFLGSVKTLPRNAACPTCQIRVCTHCRKRAHPLRFICEQEDETGALQGLLEQNRWQRCPNCRAVVELNQGCYHITCRCRSQFCYLCSAPWKTCSCRQWDERMLLVEAERRVAAQVQQGLVRPQPAPAAAPITATPPPQHRYPYANPNTQPEGNNGLTNASSQPRAVVGSRSLSWAQVSAPQSSSNGTMAQRAGNSSRHEPSGERRSSPFEHEGYGYHSQRDTQSSRPRMWAAEQGSSRGFQSHQKTQEKPREDLHQKRVKEMMERLRTNHDCNPHSWSKRNGAGKCSECHHHLPLYLLHCRSCYRDACVRCARNRL